MAIIVQDDFNRTDNPTSLGTANTGQTWNQVSGTSGNFQINSNNALWSWNPFDGAGRDVIESGFTDAVTQVTLVNPTSGSQNFGIGLGLICRYVDSNNFFQLVYYRFPGASQLRLQRTFAGATTTVADLGLTLSDNDVIKLTYCGPLFEIFVNGVSQGTYDDTGNPQNYGTLCGLVGIPGSFFALIEKRFDNFLVQTNAACTPVTYNCTGGGCVDPGDGTGTYATLAACLAACGTAVSYNCINGICIDPGNGTGTYPTLAACEASGCGAGTRGVATQRFDAGKGNFYYLVPPVADSGDELQSKTVKSIRVTGKRTNASVLGYGYDVESPINVSDLENGTNSATDVIPVANSTQVTQSERKTVNIPNAVLHTVRVQGDDTGQTTRDRIDEVVTEQSIIGVRR